MSKHENHFSVAMTERAQATIDTLRLYYLAEIAEALLSETPAGPMTRTKDRARRKTSVGQTMAKHLGHLDARQRKRFAKRLMNRDMTTGAPLSARDRLVLRRLVKPNSKENVFDRGDLIKILMEQLFPDGPVAIKDPVKAGKIWADLLTDFMPLAGDSSGGGGGGSPQPATIQHSALRLRLHEIRCLDETNPESGKDEISFAGVGLNGPAASFDPINASPSNTEMVQMQDTGKYETGDVRSWSGGTRVHDFSLNQAVMPHAFSVYFVLAETDWGGFSNFIEDLYEDIEADIATILASLAAIAGTAIASGAGIGTLAGPIGTVIGAVAGAVLGAVIGVVVSVSQDDIFPPMAIPMILSPETLAGAPFFGGNETAPFTETFVDHGGSYRLTYSWELR
jgi:hypothetical protein